ncbi:hypothetical protein ACFW9O_19145 [Streptomyces sp. NPDC059499]|uniref:hypothetical protein n=1 Tax=Streptomyces sp. NPDC059499 TaxID=3346852 RepID=UPI0036A2B7FD
MKKDPLLWGALGAVLVVLASAEYDLARACGFGTYVAAGVPAALDIYAIKALRAKRDVLVVVAALIAVNAAAHLVAAGRLPVSWQLVVAVSAIAPMVLWRVHRLSEDESTVPEPAPEPAAPIAVPVTVERDQANSVASPNPMVLGPWTPVPELTGTKTGTSHDQAFSQHWEDVRAVAELAPEPPVLHSVPVGPPIGSAGPDLESEETGNSTFDGHVKDARNWLCADPGLTGTAIGERLGKSDGYGRRVRRAALSVLAST